MSCWEVNKTGERKDCYTVTVSGPGRQELAMMLENATVFGLKGLKGTRAVFGLDVNKMTPEQAQQWFCAYQVADKRCPTQIIRKIGGNPPKEPMSCTVFVSPQPLCDVKKECLEYGKERDRILNLAEDGGEGAMSGKHDHAWDRRLLTSMRGVVFGLEGEKAPNFERKYQAMKEIYEQRWELMRMYLTELAKETRAECTVTVHRGKMSRRLSKEPRRGRFSLLEAGEFMAEDDDKRQTLVMQTSPVAEVIKSPEHHDIDAAMRPRLRVHNALREHGKLVARHRTQRQNAAATAARSGLEPVYPAFQLSDPDQFFGGSAGLP